MRMLIITVTAGNGHNATASAVEESLRARGGDVVVLDMYKYISRVLYNVVDKGYRFSIKHMPRSFGNAYASAERHEIPRRVLGILNSNRFLANRLADFLKDYQPELIITTHVFAAQVLDTLKRQGFLDVPVMGVITDYCIHPFWETVPTVEYIVTASKRLTYTAQRKGIDEARILPLGIPVAAKFRHRMDQGEARRKLGLYPDKTTVLIMGGSMGFGNMLRNVIQIDRMGMDYQLVCVCGANKKLYQKLSRQKTKSAFHVQGFTNQVDVYMDAADCIVTKPGGLTVSESLAKGLPMVLTSPIPGQEERNANFLLNSGAAVLADKHFSLSEAVHYVLESPGRLELMRQAIALIANPHAAEEISRFAMELGGRGDVSEGAV